LAFFAYLQKKTDIRSLNSNLISTFRSFSFEVITTFECIQQKIKQIKDSLASPVLVRLSVSSSKVK